MDNKIVITIGREKGSGGHYIGELLASRLGIKCYDSEILYETAKVAVSQKNLLKSMRRRNQAAFYIPW